MAKGEPKVYNEADKEALERMKTTLVDAKSNLTMAQQRMKRAMDKKSGLRSIELAMRWSSPLQICGHIVPICRLKSRHGG